MAPKLPKAWQPPAKLPKSIGECIDLGLKAYAERKKIEEVLKAFDAEYQRIKDHIINTFQKDEIDGARGKMGSASLVSKDVPKVVDKEAFGRWVAEHEAWDLLYGKAVEEACKTRWEEKITIDGIEKFHDVKVKLVPK